MNIKTSTLRWSTHLCRFSPEENTKAVEDLSAEIARLLPHIAIGGELVISVRNVPNSAENCFGEYITITLERFEELRQKQACPTPK